MQNIIKKQWSCTNCNAVSVLLGCDAVSHDIRFTMFRDTIIISSSTVWSSSWSFFVDVPTLEDKKTSCLETSGTKHRVTQRHVPAALLCSLTHTAARTFKFSNCQTAKCLSTHRHGRSAPALLTTCYIPSDTLEPSCLKLICVTCVLPVTRILLLHSSGKVRKECELTTWTASTAF
jgi:hypothetical protein